MLRGVVIGNFEKSEAMHTDEWLYQQSKRGDMGAFGQLYARYEGPLFGFITRYTGRREDAEEIFHEAFLRVLETPEAQFERGSFRSWIYKIARNLSLNHLRAEQRAQARHKSLEHEPRVPPPGAEEQLVQEQAWSALRAAFEQLPQRLSEVARLRTAGMAYEEIAHALEIPLGTVKSRMHELVKRLQEELPQ